MISPELLKKAGGVVVSKPQPPQSGDTLDIGKLDLNDNSLGLISAPKKPIDTKSQEAIASGKADPITPPNYKEATFLDKVDYALNPTTGANKHTIGWFNALAGTKALSTLKDVEMGNILATREALDKGIQKTQRIEASNPFSNAGSTKLMDTYQPTAEWNKLVTAHIVKQLENDTSADKIIKNFASEMDKTAKYYQEELEGKKVMKGQDPKKESFGEKLAEAAPSAEMFAAVAFATGGAGTAVGGLSGSAIALSGKVGMTVTEAAMEADSARDQILKKGGTEEEGIKAFQDVFGANLILIAATNKVDHVWDIDTYKNLKEFAKMVGLAGAGEGVQEGVQQMISNASTGDPIWQGVPDSFLIGMVLGGGIKGVTTSAGGASGGVVSVEDIDKAIKDPEKFISDILNNPNIPEEKKTAIVEIVKKASEERKQEIVQDAFRDGSVEGFIQTEQNKATEREIQMQQFNDIYQQQLALGVSPQTIFQEISDRTGVDIESVEQFIKDFQTTPQTTVDPTQIANELLNGTGNVENNVGNVENTQVDKATQLADEVMQQDEAVAPELVQGMENDAETQQDWETNYKTEYGDLNIQETYLRGQNQRLVQRAAKERVQKQIAEVEQKKNNLKQEFKENQNPTKEKVEGALEEKNPKKANKVLNRVGKKKTLKTTKKGVRVARVENVDKPTKKQLENRAKAEGSFLDIKKEPTDLDMVDSVEKTQSDDIIEYNNINLENASQNEMETTIEFVPGTTFTFNTQEYNDFLEGRNPEDIRYYIVGNKVYLIDVNYGDWNRNSIVGRVDYFQNQKETLFQRSSKTRFATEADIQKAFENLPIFKYLRVEKVREILTPEGRQAYGSYFNGLIKYVENPKYGTLPHEAFHATVDMVFTQAEREELFTLARQQMEGYPNKSDLMVEEYLAEQFEAYYHKIDTQTKFQKWFDKLIRFFNNVLTGKTTIENYFDAVFKDPGTRGEGRMLLPNMDMTPIDGDFILELNPETIAEAREIINEAEITREEKNFLQNILDNPVYKTKKDLENLIEEIGIRTLQIKGELANTEIRNDFAKRGNEEIGLDPETPSFYYALTTDVEHGQKMPHGVANGIENAVSWATVADTGEAYHVKEIQKLSGRALIPDLQNSNATQGEKEELKKVHQQYMDFMVLMLRDKAALDNKVIYFPTPEKAQKVNPQASIETIDKEYDQAMKNALDKFTEYSYIEDEQGGSYVIYPTATEKLVAMRFQQGDAFEIIQQNHLTTKVLNRLGSRKTVSKIFVEDLLKMPDIKKVEKELISDLLKGEPATIDVEQFKQRVRAELLPLTIDLAAFRPWLQDVSESLKQVFQKSKAWSRVVLDDAKRGNVAEYYEHIYQSPIKNTAGKAHFNQEKAPNYFGHVRIEDMAGEEVETDLRERVEIAQKLANGEETPFTTAIGRRGYVFKKGDTRRLIEIQSDLYQRDLDSAILDNQSEKLRQYKTLLWARGLFLKAIEDGKTTEEIVRQLNFGLSESFKGITSLEQLEQKIDELQKETANEKMQFEKDEKSIKQYGNPTAHFRMVREEVVRAANEGIKKLQVPTGQTAMDIEGLSSEGIQWWEVATDKDGRHQGTNRQLIKPQVGQIIQRDQDGTKWVVTSVENENKFKAVSYRMLLDFTADYMDTVNEGEPRSDQQARDQVQELISQEDMMADIDAEHAESFDMTPDTDKSHPIYKFYQNELGKYLKNTYNAKEVKDDQKNTWFEIEIKPEYAQRVEAFQRKRNDVKVQIKDLLDAEGEPILGINEKIPEGEVSMTKGDIHLAQLEDGQYMVVDGQHRVGEALKRGEKEIGAIVLTKSEVLEKYSGLLGKDFIESEIVDPTKFQTKTLADMAAEHDTLDSFIQSQGVEFYHTTPALFDKFDKKKLGSTTDYPNTYKGFFFSDKMENIEAFKKTLREGFSGDFRGEKQTMSTDNFRTITKIMNPKKFLDMRFGTGEMTVENAEALVQIFGTEDGVPRKGQDALDYIDELGQGDFFSSLEDDIADSYPHIVQKAKRKGYVGIISDFGGGEKEYIVFDPNKFANKEELVQIYNEVHGTKYQEKTAFDLLAESFLKIKKEDEGGVKRESAITRVAGELNEELKAGYYTPIQIRKELAKAEVLYTENREEAIAIAKGEIPNNTNILDLAINRYALYQAVQEGNSDNQISMIQNLSRIARQFGQNIALLRGSITENSPVQYINQLVQAKEDLARKQWKPLFKRASSIQVEDVLDSEVKKLKRKKSTKNLREKLFQEKEFELDSFLDSIKC